MSDPYELRHGRRSSNPFTMVPQWAMFMKSKGLSSTGFLLYSILLGHVNASRGDGLAWPTQESLGKMIDSHPDTVGKIINKELRPLGLVDVDVVRCGDNNSRRRNVYTVHELPPEGFEGVRSVSDWHRLYGTSRVNPQVTPETAFSSGPDPTFLPGPVPVFSPGPEATETPGETDEASTTRNPPPPTPSPVGVGVVAEDGEDLEAASGGEEHTHFEEQYTGEPEAAEPAREDSLKTEVTEAHHHKALSLMGAIPWPRRNVGLGVKVKGEIMERLAVLAAGGWSEQDIREYIDARVTVWEKVRHPANIVLFALNDAPEVIREVFVEPAPAKLSPEQKKLAELEAVHARLSAEREQQLIEVRLCADCDEGGWFWLSGRPSVGSPSWHGHGKMGLITEVNRAGSAVARYREAMEPDENLWELAPSGA